MTAPPARLHDDELPTDVATVRALVDAHDPRWAALPLRPLAASGSSNALHRLGDDLLVRVPRQPGADGTVRKEARWTAELAGLLPVPVPEVVAVGEPGPAYPGTWSVVRWLEGRTPPAGGPSTAALATDLAAVVRALRACPVPIGARDDPDLRWYRGGPLAVLADDVREALERSRPLVGDRLDLDLAADVWEQALLLPEAGAHEHWLHGDLLAENLLVSGGRLAAVLDWGGLAVGDPTADLVVAWEVLDAAGRATFRDAVDVDDVTWLRGRAWALAIAAITFPYYTRTMPRRCADRAVMLGAVLDDARGRPERAGGRV